MWQNIIVGVIGTVVFVVIAVKFYRLLVKKKSDNKCVGCNGCCDKKENCDK